MSEESKQAELLSVALAKLLRIAYEIGREEALAGEDCSRDFAKDADKFVCKRLEESESTAE